VRCMVRSMHGSFGSRIERSTRRTNQCRLKRASVLLQRRRPAARRPAYAERCQPCRRRRGPAARGEQPRLLGLEVRREQADERGGEAPAEQRVERALRQCEGPLRVFLASAA
jgi:hypothetical protein